MALTDQPDELPPLSLLLAPPSDDDVVEGSTQLRSPLIDVDSHTCPSSQSVSS